MGQRDKLDWSYKPDIHSYEPIVEIGGYEPVYRFIYDKKKQSRKVHEINPETDRAWCKVENGTKRKLTRSGHIPEGRKKCATCQQLKAEGVPANLTSRKGASQFYTSHEWSELRYKAFIEYGRECVVCGCTKKLTVDHIKPLRKYPDLAREMSNLQVMCRLCNRGKGAWDETDWRD